MVLSFFFVFCRRLENELRWVVGGETWKRQSRQSLLYCNWTVDNMLITRQQCQPVDNLVHKPWKHQLGLWMFYEMLKWDHGWLRTLVVTMMTSSLSVILHGQQSFWEKLLMLCWSLFMRVVKIIVYVCISWMQIVFYRPWGDCYLDC